jgi:DNA-binding response OmpR family regulator
VGAVLRRAPAVAPLPADTDSLSFGAITMNLRTRQVARDGEEVRLTKLEFDLLAYLAAHTGEVLPRERLLREVWDVTHEGSARTVDNFVAQLRAKLEDDPEHPRHLVTVRGAGYRLDP